MLITILAALFTLGVVIFFHELGHFIMAKRVGVKVEKFSLGFGPKLLGINYGGTEYLISAIPLGGYVKMKGEDTNEEPTGDIDEFCSRPLGDRAKVVFFGPFLNFLLAFFFFVIVFMIGIPTLDLNNKVGLVKKDTLAYKEGIQRDDVIIKVNNHKVKKWEEIEKTFLEGILSGKIVLEIERENKIIKKVLTISKEDQNKPLGIYPYISPIIGKIQKDYPAAKAGLREGDEVIKINNKKVGCWNEISEIIHNSKEKSLNILIKRGKKEIVVNVTPIFKEISSQEGMVKVGIIGISPQTKTQKFELLGSINKAFAQLILSIQYVFFVLWKLISGGISLKYLAGPLGIAQMAGQQAQSGLLSLMFFVAFLSVNLGVLNLLPIPVLDGGYLLFYAIEKLRGKAISIRAQEIASQVGLSVLVVLILFATFNDILRVFK